jgi:hypothetical protein
LSLKDLPKPGLPYPFFGTNKLNFAATWQLCLPPLVNSSTNALIDPGFVPRHWLEGSDPVIRIASAKRQFQD